MINEIKTYLESLGLQESQLKGLETCIELDATGKQENIESLADEMGLSLDEGEDQHFSALEIISVAGSLITIVDFLLKMKRLYGASLLVKVRTLSGRTVEMKIDDALHKIIKDNVK